MDSQSYLQRGWWGGGCYCYLSDSYSERQTQSSSWARALTEACRKDNPAGKLFGQASVRAQAQDDCFLIVFHLYLAI